MKFKQILKIILKNLLAFLAGIFFGIIVFLISIKPVLYLAMPKNVGLGVIALAPVIIIVYSIIFAAGSGILGLIVYNLIIFFKKWKKK